MKTIYFFVNIILASLMFHSSVAQKITPKTLLWRISGNGLQKPSYLYGTMHLKDRRLFFFGDSVYKNIQASDGFAMEIDPAEMMDSVFSKLSEKDTTSLLRKELDKREYAALSGKLEKKLGIPADKITRKKLIEYRNTWYQKTRKKDDMQTFVDIYLYDLARKQGKWIGGIEDVNDQLGLKDELGKDIDVSEFVEDNADKKFTAYLEKMISVYTSQDLDLLEILVNNSHSLTEKDMLLINRNKKMAYRMDSLSRVRTTFFAVGAAHLPGDSGLIDLLTKRGFKVEPVFSSTKIVPEDYSYTPIIIPWVKFSDPDDAYKLEMPGKPSDLKVSTEMPPLHVYADLPGNLVYMSGFSFITSEENEAAVVEKMSKSFSGKGFEKLEEKSISFNGMQGKELTSIREKNHYRLQVFAANQKIFMLMLASEVKANLFNKESERFLQSFVPNLPLKPVKKNWFVQADSLLAFEIAFPIKPSRDKLKPTETAASTETISFTAMDKVTNTYYMAIESHTTQGYYIAHDSIVFNAKLDYYKQIKAAITDIRHFDFDGYPAMSFNAQTQNEGFDFIVKILIVSKGNRNYTIATVTEKGKEDFPDVTNFFRSFKLKPFLTPILSKQLSVTNTFSTWAPGRFELEKPDTAGLSGYDLEQKLDESKKLLQYRAYEPNTASTYFVSAEAVNPYYWTANDSSFINDQISNYYNDTSSSFAKNNPGHFDSLIYQKSVTNGKAVGFELMVKNNSKSFYKRVRVLLHGDSTYQLFILAPYDIITNEDNNRFFNDFSFTNSNLPTNIFTNKTQNILSDILSKDSAIHEQAFTALSDVKFTVADLPLLHKAYLVAYPIDSNASYTENEQIAKAIIRLNDTSTYWFVKNNYAGSNSTSAQLKMAMLEMLANQHTAQSTKLIKDILLNNPPATGEIYSLVYQLKDSLLLAATLFPQAVSLYADSLLGPGFISIANQLADSNLVQQDIFSINERGILITAARQIQQLKKDVDAYPPFNRDIITALGKLPSKDAVLLLNDYVKTKDLYIKKNALLALLKNKNPVNILEIKKIAANLEYRTELYQSFKEIGQLKLYPKEFLLQQQFAESYLYNYTYDEDEQNDATFKLITEKIITESGKQQRYFLFKMQTTYEEETTSYLAVCGPFEFNKLNPELIKDKEGIKVFYNEKYEAANNNKLFKKFIEDNKAANELK